MISNFKKLGFKTPDSKILSVMIDYDWHTSKELEHKLALSQSEVSIALNRLKEHIECETIESEGKGRRERRYKLSDSFGSFVRNKIINEHNEKNNALEYILRYSSTLEKPDDQSA